ncbi:UDP-N-acetylglucosamine transferase subunit ALG13 [Parastagonospora nodorum]|nr:UDP-N-acetylglucosamine transferase subunit ALG13 [Parastagonospora nodorum]QRC99289.1 UDP-N-acetylglucosamine transferase subunit ALG13 [Parastagonospora nodorum SN15]KAH3934364.1 UDP-N-acetylglucosamine transferase subunit ALG13 [Parastagonospora nodorum]KAH3959242.1 UDP-N-acetylglucosamine transferase subunit ALG13 [Parastagonospora nodorum]KAH3984794.1 UDP-N-acetylglucosamine transferase subunit ALG13 [Parastagonospora nodorum]
MSPVPPADESDSWKWTPDSKLCFVTTGATAPFTALIESVLSIPTIETLLADGYTHLLVQYGSAKDVFTKSSHAAHAHLKQAGHEARLVIDGIDFSPEGLQNQFKLVQQSKGLVISHAGSGSILEALRYQIPLIVVPNTALLDNHQEELAVAMERSNYLIRGDVGDLTPAIQKSNDFRVKMAQFPPVTSGKHRETKSFAAIMDDTVGFLD